MQDSSSYLDAVAVPLGFVIILVLIIGLRQSSEVAGQPKMTLLWPYSCLYMWEWKFISVCMQDLDSRPYTLVYMYTWW